MSTMSLAARMRSRVAGEIPAMRGQWRDAPSDADVDHRRVFAATSDDLSGLTDSVLISITPAYCLIYFPVKAFWKTASCDLGRMKGQEKTAAKIFHAGAIGFMGIILFLLDVRRRVIGRVQQRQRDKQSCMA